MFETGSDHCQVETSILAEPIGARRMNNITILDMRVKASGLGVKLEW